MAILDNLEAYLELDEDHSSLSSKLFEEIVCKDCIDKAVD
jgi:hypothetical protein